MIRLADLLKEYSDEQRHKYLNKIDTVLSNFTTHAAHDNKADPYINAALELFPSLRYTGKLYRVIGVDPETFLGFKSNTDVLNYIKNYKTKHYQSFAKSLKGLEDFESIVLDADIQDFTPMVGVYVEQVGSGLDVEAFYKTKDSLLEFFSAGGLEKAAQVGEVIAPVDQSTMQIGMYTLDEPIDHKMYKYSPSNFKQLQRDLKDSLENHEKVTSDEEGWDEYEEKTRKGFKAPPEDAHMYTSKSIHKKSKYKKYNPSW